jgi:hypothetical protein
MFLVANQARGFVLEKPLRILANCASKQCDVTKGIEDILMWEVAPDGDEMPLADLLGADREFLGQRWTTYKSNVDRNDRTWQGLLMEILNSPKPESPGLRVLTVHAAKGLEFRAVTVLGLNEGSFPDFRNIDGESIENFSPIRLVLIDPPVAHRLITGTDYTLRSPCRPCVLWAVATARRPCLQELPDDRLHPNGQRGKSPSQIISD